MALQNIKINNVRALDAKLVSDEYFDYMLYKGETVGLSSMDECLVSYIDIDDCDSFDENGYLYSLSSWENAVCEDVIIESGKTGFGITAVDNGRYNYIKDLISNKEFLDIFFSGYTTTDTRLVLPPVTGNTLQYTYPYKMRIDHTGRYAELKGGFFQGFFKLYGLDYQTIPNYIDFDWHFEFVIRPRSDYEEICNTLNKTYPQNKGIFFYLGTRAENKYGEIYNRTYEPSFSSGNTEKLTFYDEGDFDTPEYEALKDIIFDEEDISLSGITIDAENGEYSIQTDNKHMFFDRTCTGYTTHTWDHDDEPIIEFTHLKNRNYKDNPFLIFNRTCTGYTTHTIDKYLDENYDEYDMEKDIIGNAFALKYNDDGSISYRYTIKNCSAETGYETIEESSISGLVLDNQWNVINVRLTILDHSGYDKCGRPNNLGKRRMKIMIYVNGFLVYISRELPELYLKPLNDLAERQYGVPYNISIGGGTQGLGERIWLDYYQPITDHYELEKTYAGTFIGDFKAFRMYDCMKQFMDIQNSYNTIMSDEGGCPNSNN